ncbi:MAG: lipoprotein insertase outer membrane protein LolB [Pseudomonadota bacterium]
MNFFSFFCALILAIASGCTTIQPLGSSPPVSTNDGLIQLVNYEFTGRIAVKQDEKGNYGNIRWMKRGTDTEITLFSPLGQVVAHIHSQSETVTLTVADQRKFYAENEEVLMRQVLGYSVPIKGLNYWLLGRPALSSPAEQKFRPDGLVGGFQQDGWSIGYTDYMAVGGLELPRHMVLNRDGLEIRLVIDQWNLGTDAK